MRTDEGTFILINIGMEGDIDSSMREKLSAYGQTHVLQHFDQLSVTQKTDFANQLRELDFELIHSLYTALYVNPRPCTHPEIQPYTNIMRLDELSAKATSVYRSGGLKLIATGQVALLLLAGEFGQLPTGMRDIGLISHKTLFQLFSEKLIRLRELASETTGTQAPPIPFVLMTETAAKNQVAEYFAENDFFGMEPSALCILAQNTVPLVDFEGKILLSEPGKVSVAASGVLESLCKSKAVDWLDNKGVQYVHLCAVDNVLLQVCDPVFLGIVHTDQVEAATKTIEVKEFIESARLLALKGGTLSIVEYSELNEEMKGLRDLRGRLLYGYENIVNHIVRLDLIKELDHSELRELYCMTQERVVHTGEMQPDKPNGLKFELFYSALLPFASTSVALVVKRETEFAPAKDSAESARGLLANLHMKWVEKGGGVVSEGNRSGCYCEISPLVSYSGEDLETLSSQEIALPFYLYY